jgi:hypothetical protein
MNTRIIDVRTANAWTKLLGVSKWREVSNAFTSTTVSLGEAGIRMIRDLDWRVGVFLMTSALSDFLLIVDVRMERFQHSYALRPLFISLPIREHVVIQ